MLFPRNCQHHSSLLDSPPLTLYEIYAISGLTLLNFNGQNYSWLSSLCICSIKPLPQKHMVCQGLAVASFVHSVMRLAWENNFLKTNKKTLVWSQPNFVSLWPIHFTLLRITGNILILREKCQITQYTQIPQKSGTLFNHWKFKSLYDFLKLAVPDSQGHADLLSHLSSIQSQKPFSGCFVSIAEGTILLSWTEPGTAEVHNGRGRIQCYKIILSFWLTDCWILVG